MTEEEAEEWAENSLGEPKTTQSLEKAFTITWQEPDGSNKGKRKNINKWKTNMERNNTTHKVNTDD